MVWSHELNVTFQMYQSMFIKKGSERFEKTIGLIFDKFAII